MLQGNNGEITVIDINSINEELFVQKRKNFYEEWVRCCIVKALKIAREISKYNQPFEIYRLTLPRKVMDLTTVLKKNIKEPEETITNRLQETLRWAQILSNGEISWEDLCSKPDTASFPRLVLWDGMIQTVGGGKWAIGYTNKAPISVDLFLFTKEIQDVSLSITRFPH